MSLYHALELLMQYGVKSFYIYIKSYLDGKESTKSTGQQTKLKNEFIAVEEMANYYKRFQECFEEKYYINILFFLTLKSNLKSS